MLGLLEFTAASYGGFAAAVSKLCIFYTMLPCPSAFVASRIVPRSPSVGITSVESRAESVVSPPEAGSVVVSIPQNKEASSSVIST